MLRKPFELAVIGTLIVCIIGHAGIGVVSAGDRVANADRTPNVVTLCHVACDGDAAELGGGALGGLGVEVEHRHLRALGGEGSGDGSADALCAARDESGFPGESAHVDV